MKYINPICALILSVFLFMTFVKQSIVNRRLYKNRISFSCLLIFVLSMVVIFYEDIAEKDNYVKALNYSLIGCYSLIGVAFFININSSTTKGNMDKEFIKTLEVDKLFILLDKKERVREVSTSLALEFGLEKEDMIGRKFFDILDESFQVATLNDISMDNQKVREYFKQYASRTKEGAKEKREFVLGNESNKLVVLNLVDISIFTASKYSGHLMIGDKYSEDSLMSVEKELLEKHSELEAIKARFVSHLEITEEGIFFYNIDENYIWGNDAFVSKLVLQSNSISRDEYEQNIHKDDLAYYNKIIASLTHENPNYDVTYRFKTGVNYVFVREVGKRNFSTTSSDEIVGYVEIVKNKHYERSNIEILDNIKATEELAKDIDYLYRDRKTFELVSFKIASIPEINAKNGRSVGNMVIGEYIKAITNNFVNDGYIYRISGLEFIFIITDFRKMDLLKKMLESEKLTNTCMQYGNMKIEVETFFGIALSSEAQLTKDLISFSYKALNVSQMEQVSTNYMFHKDIR